MSKLVMFFILLLFLETECEKNTHRKNISWNQLLLIADEFGVRDSINQSNSGTLVYLKEDDVRTYMKHLSESYKYESRYLACLKNIESLEEYWVMLDSFPREKRASYESETAFQADKKEMEDPDWEVYKNSSNEYPYFIFICKADGPWEPGPHDKLLPKHKKK